MNFLLFLKRSGMQYPKEFKKIKRGLSMTEKLAEMFQRSKPPLKIKECFYYSHSKERKSLLSATALYYFAGKIIVIVQLINVNEHKTERASYQKANLARGTTFMISATLHPQNKCQKLGPWHFRLYPSMMWVVMDFLKSWQVWLYSQVHSNVAAWYSCSARPNG